MDNYFDQIDAAITICDLEGIILYMNDKAKNTFKNYGGNNLIGQSLKDCHPEHAWNKILEMIKDNKSNSYTIEKNGLKKIIIQKPWFKDRQLSGLIEFSFEIPFEMAHFIRK